MPDWSYRTLLRPFLFRLPPVVARDLSLGVMGTRTGSGGRSSPPALRATGLALGVHYAVGYHSLWHLAPAWAGLGVFLLAMAASYPYLCAPADPAFEEEWRAHRA